MRPRVILDSNLIIYAVDPIDAVARSFVRRHDVGCSAASMVETLGFARLTEEAERGLREFFANCVVLPIDDAVIEEAIDLRQRRKMSLGDSLIAATAVVHGLTLATRNVDDFAWIDELSVVNPYAAR
jgi:predicted nucleic acid-binding protein